MPRSRLLHFFRYRLAEYSLRAFVALFPHVPPRLAEGFVEFSARATFFLLARYRRRMEATLLTVAGAEISDARARRELVRRAWRNFGRSVYETAAAMFVSREKLRSLVRIEGEEHLRQALAKQRGVIALSAHLGNFTMIGPRLAAEGYRFSALVKQPRDERFARLSDSYRLRVGVKTISAKPRRRSVHEILSALRRNEIVLVISDEFKGAGVEVEFLGQAAQAPRGPVTLALRTGAPIVPMFLTRDKQDRLTLTICPEVELVHTGDRKSAVAANLARIATVLEAAVRRYPDQWSWLGFRENGAGRSGPSSEDGAAALPPRTGSPP
ncbi:MAG TPA: lysophospholipid acyltransferase family protein [Candidatus Acidoferrales bacterium]|nr:lysophospholipid acyltransferase family protein [Candidatus Acidoferrales bacterium]